MPSPHPPSTPAATRPRGARRSSAPSFGPPKGWALVLLLLVALAGAFLLWRGERDDAEPAAATPTADAASVPRLLVLPFDAGGTEASSAGIADGLTADVIAALVRDHGARIGVIAQTTASSYRHSAKSPEEAMDELDLDWVLAGTVEHRGNGAGVAVRLVAPDGEVRWAETYDWPTDADVSDAIVRSVGREIGRQAVRQLATDQPAPLRPPPHTTPSAQLAYVEGLGHLFAPEPDPHRALRSFRQAVGVDPDFAAGWLGVARALDAMPRHGLEGIRRAARRALAIDPELPEAHRLIGHVRFYGDWDVEGAGDAWKRALEISPHYAAARHSIAAYYAATGRHEKALDEVRHAAALDPRSAWVVSDRGWYALFARRYGRAVEDCRDSRAIDRDYFWAEECILLAGYLDDDMEAAADAARAILRMMIDRPRGAPQGAVETAEAMDAVGDADKALEIYLRWHVDRFVRMERSGGRSARPQQGAVRWMMLGNEEQALRWLGRSVDRHQGWQLPFLPVHPLFDPLRDEPPFEALVRQVSGEAGLRLSSLQPVG